MTKPRYKKDPFQEIINSILRQLPAPPSLSSIWNIGSLLFLCLIIQIITGLLLASSYNPSSIEETFIIINFIIENSTTNWLIRYIHANGASLFFICIYIHIRRGLYYFSFKKKHTWIVGITILILTIATAFLGYVLPVNQISFWAASVITGLLSEVPYIGVDLINFIWGGPSVHTTTVVRFFTLHFLFPFLIFALTIIHISYLHTTGSSNTLGVPIIYKLVFHPFYSIKDILGILITLIIFVFICIHYPLILRDNENYIEANPIVTPHHIQPEWYFLFAYAILRSIPNKLGGVIALALSIFVLYTLPFTIKNSKIKSSNLIPISKIYFWLFINSVIILSWIGIRPVEEPFILSGQLLTIFYFSYFIFNPLISHINIQK